jgi:hypothetical protein
MAMDLKSLCADVEDVEAAVASQVIAWDEEIEHLDSRADMLVARIEDEYYQLIGSLRSREQELKEQLALLRAAREDDETRAAARDRLIRNTEVMKAAIFIVANRISSDKRRQQGGEANISTP